MERIPDNTELKELKHRINAMLYIYDLNPKLKDQEQYKHAKYEINQSNPLPCASNTITVLLATSVPLLQVCTPILTLRGIQGFANFNTGMLVFECSNPGLLPANGTVGVWTQSTGSLVLPFAKDTVAFQEYCLQFTLRNRAAQTIADQNQIHAELQGVDHVSGIRLTEPKAGNAILSNYSHLLDTSIIWNHTCEARRYRIGEVIASIWHTKVIGQSHPYPCHTNTIEVTLRPNLRLQVATTLTIAGITPTLTEDSMNLTLFGADAHVFGSLGNWNKGSGSLSLVLPS